MLLKAVHDKLILDARCKIGHGTGYVVKAWGIQEGLKFACIIEVQHNPTQPNAKKWELDFGSQVTTHLVAKGFLLFF